MKSSNIANNEQVANNVVANEETQVESTEATQTESTPEQSEGYDEPKGEVPSEQRQAATYVADTVFIVRIVDLHTGEKVEKQFETRQEGIDAYKKVIDAARQAPAETRPFIELDKYNWKATIKRRGGQIRVVVFAGEGKVYGHTGGMRSREAAKTVEQFEVPSF